MRKAKWKAGDIIALGPRERDAKLAIIAVYPDLERYATMMLHGLDTRESNIDSFENLEWDGWYLVPKEPIKRIGRRLDL